MHYNNEIFMTCMTCMKEVKCNSTIIALKLKTLITDMNLFVLFDLILYIPSTIFQLCRDGFSWVEPVLKNVLVNKEINGQEEKKHCNKNIYEFSNSNL